MEAVLRVTLPFFALVLIGWLAVRCRVLSGGTIPGLNAYVLYGALPCMLLRFSMNTPFRSLVDPLVLVVYGSAAILILTLSFRLSLYRRATVRDAAFGALVAAFPNTGFMGVSLLATLLGANAAGPVIAVMIFDMIFTSSVCIALAQGPLREERGRGGALLAAIRGAIANPLPWSIATGAVMSTFHLVLPDILGTVTQMLADSGSAVALFAIGGALAIPMKHDESDSGKDSRADIWQLSVIKVVAHPLAIWSVAHVAAFAGFGLGEGKTDAMVLAAALPSAGNAMMLAARFGANPSRVARIVLITTASAPFTFTLMASFLVAR